MSTIFSGITLVCLTLTLVVGFIDRKMWRRALDRREKALDSREEDLNGLSAALRLQVQSLDALSVALDKREASLNHLSASLQRTDDALDAELIAQGRISDKKPS